MKKIIFIIILLTSTIVLFSQEIKNDTIGIRKNVIGLDMTFFIKQFLNFNSTSDYYFANPYMLIYKREFGKSAIRTIVKFSHLSNKSSLINAYENNKSRDSYKIGIGYERNIDFYKRWKLHFGIDGNFGYEKNVDKSQYTSGSISTQTSESTEFAVLPFLNIGFEINSRITLVTESFINFSYEFSKTNLISPDSQNKSTNNGFNISYIYPTNLTLLVKF